jgi:hypothetical protein
MSPEDKVSRTLKVMNREEESEPSIIGGRVEEIGGKE